MDNQNVGSLQGVSRSWAAEVLGLPEQCLNYCAWPEVFGSTSGPFNGIGGQAMTVFTMEAWFYGRSALIFCNGKERHIVNDFEFAGAGRRSY